jgi:hypothetical protein
MNMNLTKETLALLHILALGNRQIAEGKTISSAEAFRRVRSRRSRGERAKKKRPQSGV